MTDYVPKGTDRPLGTADWAEHKDVENRYRYRDGTIWLGRSATSVPIGYADDRHVCLVSGSRSGKGTSIIINNLCLWPGSLVVVDPKGENASVTAARRGRGSLHCEGMGQAVHVIDPFRVAAVDESYRARFNPFDALDPRDPLTIDEAARLAEALVIVHPETKDPFWDDYARNMIRALILHVLTAEQFEGRRHLYTLRQLLLRGDWEKVESLQRQGVENVNSAQGLLWMSLTRNHTFGNLLPGLGDSFVDMMQNEPKVFEGVRSVALVNTEFVDSPAVAHCLEASTFRLSDLKTDPRGHSLFLCLPPMYMSQHHRWLRMMITLLVDEMQLVKGKPATGHPVLVMLDEFAGLERLKSIERAVAQIAGFGVKLFFVLQTLDQLKAVYKDWETFLANAGLKIFFGIDDDFTRQHISKLIGETEVIRSVGSETDTQSESQGSSEGVSETQGTSTSQGRSRSRGSSQSTTQGESTGESTSSTASRGGSRGESGRPGLFGLRNASYNAGENWSNSHTFGTTRSTSFSHTEGTSEGSSTSETSGTSKSAGTSHGTTRGSSRGHTEGKSDTVHRRALLAPDEIGWMFARIDDRSGVTYPGLALILISGERPIVVRRVNYYQDYQFIARFEKHPDHPFAPVRTMRLDRAAFSTRSAALPGLQWETVVGSQQVVAAGGVLARASLFAAYRDNDPDFLRAWLYVAVRAPRAGRFVGSGPTAPGGRTPDLLDGTIIHYDDGGSVVDPFSDLEELPRRLEHTRLERRAEEERARQREQERRRLEEEVRRRRQLEHDGPLQVVAIMEQILAEQTRTYKMWKVLTPAAAALGLVASIAAGMTGYAWGISMRTGALVVGTCLAAATAWQYSERKRTQATETLLKGIDDELEKRVRRINPELVQFIPKSSRVNFKWNDLAQGR